MQNRHRSQKAKKRFAALTTVTLLSAGLTLFNTSSAHSASSGHTAPSSVSTEFNQSVEIDGIALPPHNYTSVWIHASSSNGVLNIDTTGLTFIEGDGVDDSSVKFTSSKAVAQNALDSLSFRPADAFLGSAQINFELRPNDAGLSYSDHTGNFYRVATQPQKFTWHEANNHSATSSYYGAYGHMATITSPQEQAIVAPLISTHTWIGAKSPIVQTEWQWVTGPESGTIFYNGRRNGLGGCTVAPCSTTNGLYANWLINEWGNTTEPSNIANNARAVFINNAGYWIATTDNQKFSGYVAEYDGDDLIHTATTTVTVNPLPTTTTTTTPAPADSIVKPTPSSPVAVNQDGTVVEPPKPILPPTATPIHTASNSDATGSWTALTNGDIVTAGTTSHFGSMKSRPLNSPISGIAGTHSSNGYYLVGQDGGVFTFGDAKFFGSAANLPLNKPMKAIEPTCSGNGYYLIAEDGGVFTFGDATFLGSMARHPPNRRMTGLFPICDDPSSPPTGYWTYAEDGGVFTFGSANKFFGSGPALPDFGTLDYFIGSSDNHGYMLVTTNRRQFRFGSLSK